MKKSLIGLQLGIPVLLLSALLFFGAVYQWIFMSVGAALFLLLAVYPEALETVKTFPVHLRILTGCVLAAVCLHSFLIPADRHSAVLASTGWLAFAALFFLIQLLDCKSLMKIMILTGVLGAAETLYAVFMHGRAHEMVLWAPKVEHLGYFTGTFFNRNHLAGYLEMILGVQLGVLFYAIRFKRWSGVFASGCFLVICLYGLSMTASRLGIASLLTSLFVCMPFLVKKYKRSFPVILVVLLTAGLIAVFGHEILQQRFFLADGHIESSLGRPAAWLNTLALIKDHLWTGVGLDNFKWFFPYYQSADLQMGWDHAHNDYLELAANLGIPFFLLIFCQAGMFAGEFLHRFFKLQNGTEFIVWGIMVSLLSLSLHGLGDFNFAIPSNTMLWIVLVGAGWKLLNTSAETGEPL